jgi:hypothetical protein
MWIARTKAIDTVKRGQANIKERTQFNPTTTCGTRPKGNTHPRRDRLLQVTINLDRILLTVSHR